MKRSFEERKSDSDSPPALEDGDSSDHSKMNGILKTNSSSTTAMDSGDADHVAVVGAGPAGLMLA